MAWKCYKLTYELRSPLHIGYHKIGSVQRTRYYVPARNLWGAVTEALTRRGFATGGAPQGDYQKIGEWIREHCAFGYWFIEENGMSLTPCYKDDGLYYGSMTVAEFERRYLNVHVTTALDSSTTSAEAGSLHEVEFISPYPLDGNHHDGMRTIIGGFVFLDEGAQALLGDEDKWCSWLGDLQIGGERRYGFGRLHCLKFLENVTKKYSLDGERPLVQVRKSEPIPAHTPANDLRGRGNIEPLVGRQTDTSNAFGCALTRAMVCWAPGTVAEETEWFEIAREGIWRRG